MTHKKTSIQKSMIGIALALCAILVALLVPILRVSAEKAEDLTVTIGTGDDVKSVTLTDDDGDGFYEISTADELYAFAAAIQIENEQEKQRYPKINGKLTADIVVNPGTFDEYGNYTPKDGEALRSWTSIGDGYAYFGTFDGDGHTVSGLYFNDSTTEHVGLFGCVYTGATVKNVGVVNSYFYGHKYVGGVVGYSVGGTIENCYNTATVGGAGNDIGGVVGFVSNATVKNCYNTGAVKGKSDSSWEVGGVVGRLQSTEGSESARGKVINCYNTGAVSGDEDVGGVVGYINVTSSSAKADVTNCFYLTGTASKDIGDISNTGTVNKSVTETPFTFFVSGSVAYNLNGKAASGVWYQNGALPGFSGCAVTATGGVSHTFDNGFCTACGAYQAPEGQGNAPDSPYLIKNAGNLYWFAQIANNSSALQNKYIALAADIVVNPGTFDGNGNYTAKNGEAVRVWTPFALTGNNVGIAKYDSNNTFVGNYTISGLYFDDIVQNVGLFSTVDAKSTVTNIGIVNSYISGNVNVGAVAGENLGTVEYCYNTGAVNGDACVGGVVGNNKGTVKNCYNTANVGDYFKSNIGGVVGNNPGGTVAFCYSTGNVYGLDSVGGVVGASSGGTITNCYSTQSNVVGYGDTEATITNVECKDAAAFASGEVTYLLNDERPEGTEENPLVWYQYNGMPYYYGDRVTRLADGTYSAEHNYKNGFCTDCGGYEEPTSEDGVYEIENAGQLYWFAQKVNSGETFLKAKLVKDITINPGSFDADGKYTPGTDEAKGAKPRTWTPIGESYQHSYTGTFDGNGKTVSGLYFNAEQDYVGLFGDVESGTVKNVTVKDSYLNGGMDVGGIAGYNNGTIENCHNVDTVVISTPYFVESEYGGYIENNKQGTWHAGNVGGVVGYNGGEVSGCTNSGKVIGNTCEVNVISSPSSTTKTTFGGTHVGGIVGTSFGKVEKCANTGDVSGDADVGGVIGFRFDPDADSAGWVKNCYNTGTVTGTNYVGGVVGYNQDVYGVKDATVENCFNTGTVTGTGEAPEVGGVVGNSSSGPVKNCYYLADSETDEIDGTTFMTAEQFASGEVAYKLNNDAAPAVWYQQGTLPGLSGDAVTYDETSKTYTVTHTYNENGFCKTCDCFQPCTGTGTESDPYLIGNAGNLYWFAQKVNSGSTGINGKLIDDIVVNPGKFDANGNYTPGEGEAAGTKPRVWTPIGNYDNKYEGTFDGAGHSISGLYFNDSQTEYVGLFGCVGGTHETELKENKTAIRGVTLKNSYLCGGERVGGIAGDVQDVGNKVKTTISECMVQSDVTVQGTQFVGGVVGANFGTVTRCGSGATVTGETNVGGVVGHNVNVVHSCYNVGTVHGERHGVPDAGGVVGFNSSSGAAVTDCYYLAGCATKTDLNPGITTPCYGIGGTSADKESETGAMTAADFASGEVAYKLNGSVGAGFWKQTLEGTDKQALPAFTGDKVYYGYLSCADDAVAVYTNNSNAKDTKPAHNYVNGICEETAGETHYEPCKYGDGTANDPYKIQNAGNLYWFAAQVNSGRTDICALLNNGDITINAGTFDQNGTYTPGEGEAEGTKPRAWTPIGTAEHPFIGTFDGGGNTIFGLYFNDTNKYDVGLFGVVGDKQDETSHSGTIKNVTVENVCLCGGGRVGGIAGKIVSGSVESCNVKNVYVFGEVSYIGGIVGENYGTVENCYNTGTVSGNYAGGVVGRNDGGTVENCYNTGTVSGNYAGGVVGYNAANSKVTSCYNTGTVSGDIAVGGVVGVNQASGTVTNCYNTGNVSGTGYVGGAVGFNEGEVTNCYYLTDTASTGIGNGESTSTNVEAMTAADFASGKVAYLLNGKKSDGELAWYQYLDKDNGHKYPCLVKNEQHIVYCGYEPYDCDESHGVIYTNNSGNIVDTKPDHNRNNVKYESNGDATHKVICRTCSKTLEEAEDCVLGSDSSCTKYGCTYQCPHTNDANGDKFCDDCGASTDVPTLNDNGTPDNVLDDYYEIRTVAQLYWFAQKVNNNAQYTIKIGENEEAYEITRRYAEIKAVLMNDIVVNPGTFDKDGNYTPAGNETLREWEPIGSGTYNYYAEFDGNGYTVSGLYCDQPDYMYVGFFGYMNGNYALDDLHIANSFFRGKNAGAIAGYGETTMTGCSVSANVYIIGSEKAGGLIGNGSSYINKCFALAQVSGGTWGGLVGGGSNISNSYTNSKRPAGSYFNDTQCTNVYYLYDDTNYNAEGSTGHKPQFTGAVELEKIDFTSGRLTWLLNGETSDGDLVWKQTLDGTSYPGFSGGTVYKMINDGCKGSKEEQFSNNAGETFEAEHAYTNGFCTNDGCDNIYEPAVDWGDYYGIYNAGQLYWFAQQVNSGDTDINGKLMEDITVNKDVLVSGALSGLHGEFRQWTPIGTETNYYFYMGTFDGDGHTISGLYFNAVQDYVGLFGYVGFGTVKNVTVKDSYFNGGLYVGGIVGYNSNMGTIENCHNDNTLVVSTPYFVEIANGSYTKDGKIGSWYGGSVGGIVGANNGTVTNCTNAGTVIGKTQSANPATSGETTVGGGDVGGIVGENYINGTVEKCANTGNVSGDVNVGGVVGSNRGSSPDVATVDDCYNTGKVSGTNCVGGVVGYNADNSEVVSCYNTGTVTRTDTGTDTGTDNSVGSVVGCNDTNGTVENCYYLTGTASIGIGNTTVDEVHSTDLETEAVFTSGMVTWLLNGVGRDPVWKQTLNGTNYPSFEGEIVYGYMNCANEQKFANTATEDNSHSYKNGFCTACNAYQPAVKNGDVYEIYNAGQLYWFAGLVNGTLTDGTAQNASANGKLMANITVNPGTFDENGNYTAKNGESVRTWTPIGNNEKATNIYVGDFDGNGKTISGLYFNEVQNYVGLFGVVSSGTIKNLTVKDSYFNGGQYVGAVVGSNDSNLENCHNDNTIVVSTPYFVEEENGSFKDGDKIGYWYGGDVGGVAGSSGGLMNNCTSSGKVIGKTCNATYKDGDPCPYQVGGEDIGGIVGINWGEITNCYNTGTVIGDVYVGGVVGWNIGTVKNCYNTGAVSGDSGVGGVVGWNISTVTNCYNQADISGDACVGGVVGINGHPQAPTDYGGTVENCYNTGNVSDSQNNAGGIGTNYCIGSVVGCNVSGSTVTNCYYKKGTASAGIGGDSTNNAVADATGVTEAMEEADFLSGKVTWLLNGKKSDGVWKQTLNNTNYPNFADEDKVYYGYTSCANNAEKEYTNNEKASAEKPHTFDANGFCDNCDGETHYQAPEKGNGTAESPYEIANAGNLYWFAEKVNGGETGINARLMKNITVNENVLNTDGSLKDTPARVWTPIGTNDNGYTGTFDGGIYDTDGKLTGTYTISGLYFEGNGTEEYVGLFGYIGKFDNGVIKATVKNVTLKDSYFCGKNKVGGIVGHNYHSNIENCHNFATVKAGGESVGGIVGTSFGTVSDCTNSGTVSGGSDVGGIAGKSIDMGKITNCTNRGNVSGGSGVGGVVGENQGEVKDCGNTADAKVTGTYQYAGGVCGKNDGGTLKNVYNAGTVTGVDHVGGVCGYNTYDLINVYNTGAVTGANYVGGVVGYNTAEFSEVINCFNTGTVTGTSYVGGVVGRKSSGMVSNCYYLSDCATVTKDGTTTTQYGIGASEGTTADETGKTTGYDLDTFKSGKVTYLLNVSESNENVVWKQTLGASADKYPNFTSENIVYYGYLNCKDGKVYTNNKSASNTVTHASYTNGFCDACGIYQKPAGSGTADDPYQIDNAGKLYWFANEVNSGKTTIHAKLMADIEVNKGVLINGTLHAEPFDFRVWTPIGSDSNKYTGTFDGNNKTISGLYCNDSDQNLAGLFGVVGNQTTNIGGTVKNVTVKESYFRGEMYVGGVVAFCYNGRIEGCANEGSVCYAWGNAGGVVGYNSDESIIKNCYNTGLVNSETNIAGGVAGSNEGTIENCYNTGSVVCNGTYVGGVVGQNGGAVTNCYYLGTSETDDIEGTTYMTAADFTSGKVTWLLNGKTSTGVWKQTLNGTEYPNFTSESIVYGYYENCTKVNFTNTKDQDGSESPKAHNYVDNNGFCTVCDAYQPCEGAGTAESPYLITNAGNLYWFAAYVNQGGDNAKACAKLVDDITVNSEVFINGTLKNALVSDFRVWTPIGNKNNQYTGTFDGNGKYISGLYFENSGTKYVGLFGYVGAGGTVKNVTVKDSYFRGDTLVGGIVGSNAGTVANCAFAGKVEGASSTVGGIAGYNDASGVIENCHNSGTVKVAYSNVGGVVGINVGTVKNCYNTGNVNGIDNVGGVLGFNRGTVTNCYNIGDDVSGGQNVGGVVGYNGQNGSVTNCYNTGTVTGTGKYVGGVVGENSGTVTNCYNTGTVSGNCSVGGVVGHNASDLVSDGTAKNCYYLSGCATDGDGTVQNGVGNETQGKKTTDVSGWTAGYDLDTFKSGMIAYLLNGSKSDETVVWKQTIGTHGTPGFTGSIVYTYKDCQTIDRYTNDKDAKDNDHYFDTNGFCASCDVYQPAVLNDNGTPDDESDDYYEIYNAGQLYWFAAEVNGGKTSINGKLMKDITVNTGVLNADGTLNETNKANFRTWTPIGSLTFDEENHLTASNGYTGTFDGAGHSISGLYANAGGDYVGLFGVVGTFGGDYDEYGEFTQNETVASGTVKNVTLKDAYVRGGSYVGGIAGYVLSGTVDNSKAENVTVIGTGGAIGGIAGENNGTVSNCTASGIVSGDHNVGGIAGWNNGNVTGCAALQTSITATGATGKVGGVVGYFDNGKIEKCYAIVTAISGKNCVGGILGGSNNSNATVENCYAVVTTLSGSGNTYCYVGGIAGAIGNGTRLINCYSYCTSISGICVGGVVGYGYNGQPYQNCYWLDTCGATSDVGHNEHNLENEAESMTAADFESGKVAYLLNGKKSDGVWKQTLNGTNLPGFDGEKVYKKTKSGGCSNNTKEYFSNTEGQSFEAPHTYDQNGFCACGAYEPCAGAGTAENPYKITNAGNLYWFAQEVNNGNTGIHGILTQDITDNSTMPRLSSGSRIRKAREATTPRTWKPIGTENKSFRGTFNGDGKTISGLYHNNDNTDYVGLFGCVFDGTVQNVTVKDSYFCGKDNVGGIVGCNIEGTVTGCCNEGTVMGGTRVGGVVGYNESKKTVVSQCSNSGTVACTGKGAGMAGGIVGDHTAGTVINCYNTGTVSGSLNIGGVVGNHYGGSIKNCYNTGTVTGNSKVGGVAGNNNSSNGATIENCYYLDSCGASGEGTAKTNTEFKDGTVVHLLIGDDENSVWKQTLGSEGSEGDATPNFAGEKVYRYYTDCINIEYTNTKDSTKSEKPLKHTYENGVCKVCKYECPHDSYSKVTKTCNECGKSCLHESYTNGFCNKCDDYQKAVLNNGVYEISNAGQLYWFAAEVNGGNKSINGKLMKDITVNTGVLNADGTLNGNGSTFRTWTPIGNDSNQYTGTFDGNGHTVSGLYFNDSTKDYVGLFGAIEETTVQKVGVIDSYLLGNMRVGGIAGYSTGTIEYCYNTGYIAGGNCVGGVAGQSDGTVRDCYNSGSVTGTGYVGGVAGLSTNWLGYCYNVGKVTGTGESAYVGSIVGGNNQTVTHCYYLADTAENAIGNSNNANETNVESKTQSEFKNGSVAWLLNREKSNGVWKQTLGPDTYPNFTGLSVWYDTDAQKYVNELIIVDISWTSMEFTYKDGEYDPETHTYETGTWSTEGGGTVTVKNVGSHTITAGFTYTTSRTDIQGTLTPESFDVAPGAESTTTLTLSGRPNGNLSNEQLGNITVSITKKQSE